MTNYVELRIIVTPTHVDRVQLFSDDDDGQTQGLELYRKLISEIQNFTRRANQILKSEAMCQTPSEQTA